MRSCTGKDGAVWGLSLTGSADAQSAQLIYAMDLDFGLMGLM
jgi:hypothetical protein